MTIGPEADVLESLPLDLLGQKTRKLIVDLAGMDVIEAPPVFLVRSFFRTRAAGGQLRFVATNEQVFRPFHIGIVLANAKAPYSVVQDQQSWPRHAKSRAPARGGVVQPAESD